uniref:Uncharacterized protein n=1 Tax=Arundo donax TaxID=35708 RepID=A0A0A9AX50_ARUDO
MVILKALLTKLSLLAGMNIRPANPHMIMFLCPRKLEKSILE